MDNLKRLKKKFTKDNYFNYGRKFALVSNVLFGGISVALLIGGFFVRFGTQTINSSTLQRIRDSAGSTFGVSLSTDNFRPLTESMYQAFGIALIVIGLFTAPFSVLGFYSFYHRKRKLLIAYVVVVGFLLLIQIIMNYNIITSPETIQKWMKPYLQEKIVEYNGMDSTDQVSLSWNYLMQEYQCCGIDSVSDFQSSAFYARSGCYYYYYYGYNIVPGCCKTLPSSGAYYWCSSYQVYCGSYSYDTNYWRQGCVQALYNAYYSSHTKVIWALTGIGVIVQIVLITIGVTLISSIKGKGGSSAFLQSYENDIWTAGNHTITSERNQLPPTATTLGTKPIASRIQQTKGMAITVPGQLSFHSNQGPSVTVPAAVPPSHLQTIATHQHSSSPAQPYLPGTVIPVPTSVDKDQMVRQNSNIPLARPTTHTQSLSPTSTSVPAPVEQPIYVQKPTEVQQNRRTLTVTDVA